MSQAQLIQKTRKSYRVKRPTQTGFSSPATHYTEPRIDLNDALIENPSASFFVRVINDAFSDFKIYKDDVLIIDKSLTPKNNQLALVIKEEEFKIVRIKAESNTECQLWGVITYVIKSVL